jgi:hypothetical protein
MVNAGVFGDEVRRDFFHLISAINNYTNISFLDFIHRLLWFKTQLFGDWILPPSSGENYTVRPNRYS